MHMHMCMHMSCATCACGDSLHHLRLQVSCIDLFDVAGQLSQVTLVVASDGLWDLWQYKDVLQYSLGKPPPTGTAEVFAPLGALVEETRKQGEQLFTCNPVYHSLQPCVPQLATPRLQARSSSASRPTTSPQLSCAATSSRSDWARGSVRLRYARYCVPASLSLSYHVFGIRASDVLGVRGPAIAGIVYCV